MQGWIKLHRSIKDNWIWQNSVYLKMWIDFLIRANHKDNKFLIGKELVTTNRSSFVTSLTKLAKEYRSSIGSVRHFLEILENDSMIVLKTTHKYTHITLCNYDSYQDEQHTNGNQDEIKMKSNENQDETNKNDKNVNNEKNEKKLSKKDLRVEATPNELGEFHPLQIFIKTLDFVPKIKKQLSYKEAVELVDRFGKETVTIVLRNMENWDGIVKKNSVYLTAITWIERDRAKK